MRLDLGAGDAPVPGAVAVDVRWSVRPGVLADVAALPFRSGSVEAVTAFDVLEHLPSVHAPLVLAEWVRVLEPGGSLTVRVPDALMELERHAGRFDLDRLEWFLMGTPEVPFQAHQALWSTVRLVEAMEAAGVECRKVSHDGHPNVTVVAVR